MDQITVSTSVQSPAFAAFKAESRVSFIRPYDPKACVPVDGFRYAILRYRDTGKNTASKPAQAVCVPQVTLPEDSYLLPAQATQVLLSVLEDQQDVMIKAAIANDAKLIQWDDLSLDKVLDALTAIQTSQRLTKEQIEAWVMVAMLPTLTKRGTSIAEGKGFKQGSEEWNKQVAVVIGNYKAKFSTLSAPVPNIQQEQAIALKNMLTQANLADDISKSLGKKIHAILNPEILEGVEL